MVGVRAAMIDDVIVAQMRHAVTQLVSDLNDALRKQDLLAENCRVLEESGSMHELSLAKEEIAVLRKQIMSMHNERAAEGDQYRQELKELRDIAMQRLEEAENVGKTAMEESEQVWRNRLSQIENENVLLREAERVANDEHKAMQLNVEIMNAQVAAMKKERDVLSSTLNNDRQAQNTMKAQVKARHEEMLEMMQEQESQIERLRGERDEIEPILSGLKRDIERLEASRARAREDAARAIKEAQSHMQAAHKSKDQSEKLVEAVQVLRRELSLSQEKSRELAEAADQKTSEGQSERMALLQALEEVNAEVSSLRKILADNGISISVKYRGGAEQPSFVAKYASSSVAAASAPPQAQTPPRGEQSPSPETIYSQQQQQQQQQPPQRALSPPQPTSWSLPPQEQPATEQVMSTSTQHAVRSPAGATPSGKLVNQEGAGPFECLRPFRASAFVTVFVQGAKLLSGAGTCWVLLRLNGASFETPQKGGQSPEWRQSYRFALDDDSTDNSLSLEVHCGTAFSSASINLQSLSTSSFDGWLPLNGDFGGEVCVRATLTPLPFDTRVTYGTVEVLRGTNAQPRWIESVVVVDSLTQEVRQFDNETDMRARPWSGIGSESCILVRSCDAAGGGLVNAFVVSDGLGGRLVLRAKTADSANKWVEAITAVMGKSTGNDTCLNLRAKIVKGRNIPVMGDRGVRCRVCCGSQVMSTKVVTGTGAPTFDETASLTITPGTEAVIIEVNEVPSDLNEARSRTIGYARRRLDDIISAGEEGGWLELLDEYNERVTGPGGVAAAISVKFEVGSLGSATATSTTSLQQQQQQQQVQSGSVVKEQSAAPPPPARSNSPLPPSASILSPPPQPPTAPTTGSALEMYSVGGRAAPLLNVRGMEETRMGGGVDLTGGRAVWCLSVWRDMLWAGCEDGVIRGHDLSTGELKAELDGHSDLVLSMAVHGSTLFSGSGDTTIQEWDLNTRTCKGVHIGHSQRVGSLVLVPTTRSRAGGETLASGSADDTIRLWVPGVGGTKTQCHRTLTGHTDSVLALAAADGYLLSGAIDQTIIVWDPAQDWAILHRLRAHSGHVLSIIGVPGHAVSTSDDGAVCVWDTKTWSLKNSFEDDTGEAVSHMGYVPSDADAGAGLLICTRDTSVNIYDPVAFGWREPIKRLTIADVQGGAGDEEMRRQGGVVCSLVACAESFYTGNYAGIISRWK